jgi:integrase
LKEVGADQIGKATFVGPQQERMKVHELLDALEADYQLRGKVSPQFRSHLKHIRNHFGVWRAADVTAEAVDGYILQSQQAGLAAATINRSTQLLAQAFKLAIERKHLSSAPQIRHLSEKGNARQGFFSDADFNALKEKLPEHLRDFVHFGYLTGWRKGEIASLCWADVEGDLVRLRGENSKNGEGRSVFVTGNSADLIKRRRAQRQVETTTGALLSAFVFHQKGLPIGDFRKAWATACVAAGLGHFVCDRCKQAVSGHRCMGCGGETRYTGRIFHDLRRTAVRNMVRAGVPERVAMTISGHKTRAIFDRYNIVNEADLREAMQRTESYLKDGAQQPNHSHVIQMKAAQN